MRIRPINRVARAMAYNRPRTQVVKSKKVKVLTLETRISTMMQSELQFQKLPVKNNRDNSEE